MAMSTRKPTSYEDIDDGDFEEEEDEDEDEEGELDNDEDVVTPQIDENTDDHYLDDDDDHKPSVKSDGDGDSEGTSGGESGGGQGESESEGSGKEPAKEMRVRERKSSSMVEPHDVDLDFGEDSDLEARRERIQGTVDSDEGEVSSEEDGEIVNQSACSQPASKVRSSSRMDTTICRHYIAGTCDWGRSCRFRHPTADELVELKEKGLLPDLRSQRHDKREERWSDLRGGTGGGARHHGPPFPGHFGMRPGMYPPRDFAPGFQEPRRPYPPPPPHHGMFRPPGWMGYRPEFQGGMEESEGWIKLKMVPQFGMDLEDSLRFRKRKSKYSDADSDSSEEKKIKKKKKSKLKTDSDEGSERKKSKKRSKDKSLKTVATLSSDDSFSKEKSKKRHKSDGRKKREEDLEWES